MIRHWVERAFAAVVLLWFGVVTTEPAALHLCPVHGAPPASAGQHASGHSHSQHPADGAASCTCVGDCSAGGFSVAFASPQQRLVAATPAGAPVVPMASERPRAGAPAFLLPYANGPPEAPTLA